MTIASADVVGLTGNNRIDGLVQGSRWEFGGGAGGGQFRINGIAQAANQNIDLSAADLTNTLYAAGGIQGAETLWVQA